MGRYGLTLQITKKCRGLHISLHSPKEKKFCDYCQDYVEFEQKHCVCCFSKIELNSRPHRDWIKKFQIAIDNLGWNLDDWVPIACEGEQPRVRIKTGKRIQLNYYVPVRYLVEFRDLQHQDNEDAFSKFFDRVTSVCPRTP